LARANNGSSQKRRHVFFKSTCGHPRGNSEDYVKLILCFFENEKSYTGNVFIQFRRPLPVTWNVKGFM
jgi:hypothetical protein